MGRALELFGKKLWQYMQIQNFYFSVLQILPKNIIDEEIIKIENSWKKKLQTHEFGMNDN